MVFILWVPRASSWLLSRHSGLIEFSSFLVFLAADHRVVLLSVPVATESCLWEAAAWGEDADKDWPWVTEDRNLHSLRALPQVPGVMSQSQGLLKSQRQPQANRGSRTYLLEAKVFTLHLSFRNAPIPLGGQKGAYRNILWAEQTECGDFQKSAVTFWFSFCFPEGKGVRFYIFPYVGVHIWIKHILALWVTVWRDCLCFQCEGNFGNRDVLIDDGELGSASIEVIYVSAETGLLLDM